MRQLTPGVPFVLLIDDSLQAGETIQSQLMQIACNWTLGEHDLRALGCVGVFLADNESLAETSARRSDLAVLDRMVTLRITANDTAWRSTLAERYRGLGPDRGVPDLGRAHPVPALAALPAHPSARPGLRPRRVPAVLGTAAGGRGAAAAARPQGRRHARAGPHRRASRRHRRGPGPPQPRHHPRPGAEHSARRGPGELGGAAPGPARLRQDGDHQGGGPRGERKRSGVLLAAGDQRGGSVRADPHPGRHTGHPAQPCAGRVPTPR